MPVANIAHNGVGLLLGLGLGWMIASRRGLRHRGRHDDERCWWLILVALAVIGRPYVNFSPAAAIDEAQTLDTMR